MLAKMPKDLVKVNVKMSCINYYLVESKLKKVDEEQQKQEQEKQSNTDEAVLREEERPTKRRKKSRVRSKNNFIDAMLQEGSGEDDYADLEDWIVDEEERPNYEDYVNPHAE